MLVSCQLHDWKHISIKFQSKYKKNDLIWKYILQTGGRFVRSQHFNRLDKQSSKNAGDHFFFHRIISDLWSKRARLNVWFRSTPEHIFQMPHYEIRTRVTYCSEKIVFGITALFVTAGAVAHGSPYHKLTVVLWYVFFCFFFVCLGFIGRLGGLMPPIQPHFPELLHWHWDNKTIATLYDCPGTIKVMIVKKMNTYT